MAKGFSDTSKVTGRRGFFRQLAISAIETVEQVGKEMADRSLKGFREVEAPRYTPPLPPSSNRYLNPQFAVYGPPWPPPYGPYVTPELRAALQAERDAKREAAGSPVPR